MPMTNAERQRQYRQRHLKDLDGTGERLNVVLSLHAKAALERLASFYGITQREALERALLDAQDRATAGLTSFQYQQFADRQLHAPEHPLGG